MVGYGLVFSRTVIGRIHFDAHTLLFASLFFISVLGVQRPPVHEKLNMLRTDELRIANWAPGSESPDPRQSISFPEPRSDCFSEPPNAHEQREQRKRLHE